MEISNSDEKFLPTIDWMKDKYDQLNTWIFRGALGECEFEIYTRGKGMERSLGHFRISGEGIRYNKRTRQMFWCQSLNGIRMDITRANFVKLAKPIIGFNGHYKRKEADWVATMVHEMCHYYTYMNGIVPVQAHGTAFRQICSVVAQRSNGLFEIKRLCDAEHVGEVDDEIKNRREKRDANKKSKMTALLIFMTNGAVRLLTTTHQRVIDEVLEASNKLVCRKILATNDTQYIEYLWSKGYKTNVQSYRYWTVTDKDVVEEIKNYNHRTLMESLSVRESHSISVDDIRLMVESVLERIMDNEDDMGDITPDMILSDMSPLDL